MARFFNGRLVVAVSTHCTRPAVPLTAGIVLAPMASMPASTRTPMLHSLARRALKSRMPGTLGGRVGISKSGTPAARLQIGEGRGVVVQAEDGRQADALARLRQPFQFSAQLGASRLVVQPSARCTLLRSLCSVSRLSGRKAARAWKPCLTRFSAISSG